MPDLTIEYYYHCMSNENFSTLIKGSGTRSYRVRFGQMHPRHAYQYDWTCECDGFRYRGKCKHIAVAKKQHCGWYQFTDGGEPRNGKCPNCNGKVRSQGHGV